MLEKESETQNFATKGELKLALLGAPIRHSLSPSIHQYWLKEHGIKGSFELQELPQGWPLENLPLLIQEKEYQGLNITMPYKKLFLPFVAVPDESVQQTGSLNTLKRLPSGELAAINSDVKGCLDLLKTLCLKEPQRRFQKAVILGTGGSAQSVGYALQCLGSAHITFVTRKLEGSAIEPLSPQLFQCGWGSALVTSLEEADLVVNATPQGMKDVQTSLPLIPLEILPQRTVIMELVYHPKQTFLLKEARKRGLYCFDGIDFLLAQARHSFHFWTGVWPTSLPNIRG